MLGQLTVLRRGPNKPYPNGGWHTTWRVRCSCGVEFDHPSHTLRKMKHPRCEACRLAAVTPPESARVCKHCGNPTRGTNGTVTECGPCYRQAMPSRGGRDQGGRPKFTERRERIAFGKLYARCRILRKVAMAAVRSAERVARVAAEAHAHEAERLEREAARKMRQAEQLKARQFTADLRRRDRGAAKRAADEARARARAEARALLRAAEDDRRKAAEALAAARGLHVDDGSRLRQALRWRTRRVTCIGCGAREAAPQAADVTP